MPPFFQCARHRFRGQPLAPYTARIHIAARAMGSTFLPFGEDADHFDATPEDEAFTALWSVWLMATGIGDYAFVPDPTERAMQWADEEGLEIMPLAGSEIYAAWQPIAREILDQLAIAVLPRGMERSNPVDLMPLDWWADYVADVHAGTGLTEPEIIEQMPLARGLMYCNLASRKAGFELEPIT